jgi:hypothetical protein
VGENPVKTKKVGKTEEKGEKKGKSVGKHKNKRVTFIYGTAYSLFFCWPANLDVISLAVRMVKPLSDSRVKEKVKDKGSTKIPVKNKTDPLANLRKRLLNKKKEQLLLEYNIRVCDLKGKPSDKLQEKHLRARKMQEEIEVLHHICEDRIYII